MMKRQTGLLVIIAMVLTLVWSSEAQPQVKRIPRIGYLSALDAASEAIILEATRGALREAGYIEGKNIAIEYRYANGRPDAYAGLAADLVRSNVDLIIAAGGNLLVRAAKKATATIPIVMVGRGSDPVAAGLVESLGRPGGNVTGLTSLSVELGGKRLELLKEAVPRLGRVAVLYDPSAPTGVRDVKEILPGAARVLGLSIQPVEVSRTDDVEQLFAVLGKERADGLYVPDSGPVIRANGKRIARLALKRRLASMFDNREAVDGGGLIYYGAELADSYRRVAIYVDRILKGAKAADLPVEQPRKFELVINLKSAKEIGLAIPQSMLYRADRVIK